MTSNTRKLSVRREQASPSQSCSGYEDRLNRAYRDNGEDEEDTPIDSLHSGQNVTVADEEREESVKEGKEESNKDEAEYEDEHVLSEVHIHPENGYVDGRLLTSYFTIFPPDYGKIVMAPGQTESASAGDSDDDDDGSHGGIVLEIRHTMGSTLRDVEHRVSFQDTVAMELGAGTGLASIAFDVTCTLDRIFCTDYDDSLLRNCFANIDQNTPEASPSHVQVRRLNWLMDDPLSLSAPDNLDEVEGTTSVVDPFAWTEEDMTLWKAKGSLLFAADDMNVVAQAYEYFVQRVACSSSIQAALLEPPTIKYCDYERSNDLVLFKVWCR
ncbi:Methyltransferase-like protein 22 [Actinomortierella ambigua]|uniref:Methyltransferase-like protein 22 n=1 Tax=Actinomortierella ambigua TaxID=1343610 RepID=A0A9P6QHH1_9FUNG|nr:Methyltransferase-like protein 22 [Actinomortierella ambigua]